MARLAINAERRLHGSPSEKRRQHKIADFNAQLLHIDRSLTVGEESLPVPQR